MGTASNDEVQEHERFLLFQKPQKL